MNIIGWIRDLFGIQKDMYETKKTRLEIEKIEDEKREKLITPVTLADVKKYDPKTKELLRRIIDEDDILYARPPRSMGCMLRPSAFFAGIILMRIAVAVILIILLVRYLPRLW